MKYQLTCGRLYHDDPWKEVAVLDAAMILQQDKHFYSIAELLAEFPQGVFYKDETGVITSCNLGAIVAGGIQNSVASIVEKGIKTNDYITEIMKKTSTNIINVLGMASYSIRSASVQREEALKTLMASIVAKFNAKYEGLAKAEIEFEMHLPPFEKAEDDRIEKCYQLFQ